MAHANETLSNPEYSLAQAELTGHARYLLDVTHAKGQANFSNPRPTTRREKAQFLHSWLATGGRDASYISTSQKWTTQSFRKEVVIRNHADEHERLHIIEHAVTDLDSGAVTESLRIKHATVHVNYYLNDQTTTTENIDWDVELLEPISDPEVVNRIAASINRDGSVHSWLSS